MLSLSRRVFPALHTTRSFSYTALIRNATAGSTTPNDPELTTREQTIWTKLTNKFEPSQLQIQDVSGGCGTFYAIVIASDKFTGLPMVKQHKLVTETLKEEIAGIHGLQIQTIAK
ncbi:bola protein [Crepidotus variabilis]|uniref:Bola protein n=1 Tax=Crepidotus variabilis TaxID=179855 RepID=A0A9P6JWF4_9AGAR|nr:bola protein [Crepidotus variabilis]